VHAHARARVCAHTCIPFVQTPAYLVDLELLGAANALQRLEALKGHLAGAGDELDHEGKVLLAQLRQHLEEPPVGSRACMGVCAHASGAHGATGNPSHAHVQASDGKGGGAFGTRACMPSFA